jgi:hypothetical protein
MTTITLSLAFALFVLFPVCLVLLNKNYSTKEKAVGVLISALFSWVGFVVFFLLMLAKKKAS